MVVVEAVVVGDGKGNDDIINPYPAVLVSLTKQKQKEKESRTKSD